MTTEYFRVKNGLLIGENKFEINADTGVVTTADGSTITNTELRAVTGGYAVITDQYEDNYFYVDDNVTQATAGSYTWLFNNDGTTQFPGYKFPQEDGLANQVLKTNGAGILTWQNDTNTDAVTSVNSKTGTVVLTTSDISEGSNLYYTTARANTDFDTRLATKSTTNLSEGSNLYYTTARANTDFDTRLATKSTTNLSEGSNLYYTEARVDAHVFTNVNIDSRSYLDTTTLTTSATTANQVLDSFSATTYRTAKYIISISSGSSYQAVEMLVIHDGTTVNQVIYADLATNNNLATFTVDISGGNVRLLTTPTNSVTVYKLTRTAIVV